MADDSTPAFTLASIREIQDEAMRALMREDYREVMFQLDRIRERASWVEKMMWRRLNRPVTENVSGP